VPEPFKTLFNRDAALRLERRHPMRAITTRRYYDGAHRVEALVNGRPVAAAAFELSGACPGLGTAGA
jgi:hypothetical protein